MTDLLPNTGDLIMINAITALVLLAGWLGDPEAVASPENARDLTNERHVFEMVVRSSKMEAGDGPCYLDSEKDYRNAKNLAIRIDRDDLHEFRMVGIDQPEQFYLKKTIRVTGVAVVARKDKQIELHVFCPSQMKVIK
jgi:hypothetical protein